MFTSVTDAIGVINRQGVSVEDYRLACEYLIANRAELQQRVFICLPGGLGGNSDSSWDAVKAGSEGRCSCGNERVIVPLNLRTEFKAAPSRLVVTGKPVYLKPVGGDKASAFVRLDVRQGVLAFVEDPFAPFVLRADVFSIRGYELQRLADFMSDPSWPPTFMLKVGETPVPIFVIESVSVDAGTVTIVPDIAVEAFDPGKLPDHVC